MLDRSRGEWGEPADDVATMTMNYLFFSLQRSGRLEGPFETMFTSFYEHYLKTTDEWEMLDVTAPFYAWRGLVVASPAWYPHLALPVRKAIFLLHRKRPCNRPFRPRAGEKVSGMSAQGFGIWITGIPASGKSSLTRALVAKLRDRGVNAIVLESDEMRRILTPEPGYGPDERDRFYRTLALLGEVITKHGVNVIFDATANQRRHLDEARSRIPVFMEVYVSCPLAVCVKRDPKGIYARAASGEASTVPGIQDVYEPPARRKGLAIY